jgi:hypothetical protein
MHCLSTALFPIVHMHPQYWHIVTQIIMWAAQILELDCLVLCFFHFLEHVWQSAGSACKVQILPGLRRMFNTLIMSAPAMFNVGSLLFLVIFVYGVLGMNLFGLEPRMEQARHAHFRTIGASLLLMFRVFTGDDWLIVMRTTSGCNAFGYDCDWHKVRTPNTPQALNIQVAYSW